MYEILNLLIRGKLTYNLIPPGRNFVEWMENLDRDKHGNGPVLYFSHLPNKLIPDHVLSKVCTKFNNFYHSTKH